MKAAVVEGKVQRISAVCPSPEKDFDPYGPQSKEWRASIVKDLNSSFSAAPREEKRTTQWSGTGWEAVLSSEQQDLYDPPVFSVRLMVADSDGWKAFWTRFQRAGVAGEIVQLCRDTQLPFHDRYWDVYDKSKSATSKSKVDCLRRLPRVFTPAARKALAKGSPEAVGERYQVRLDVSRIVFQKTKGEWKLFERAYEE